MPARALRNLAAIEEYLRAALRGVSVVSHDRVEAFVPRQVLLTVDRDGQRLVLSVSSSLLAFDDPREVVAVLDAHRVSERLVDGEPYLIVREDGAEPFDP